VKHLVVPGAYQSRESHVSYRPNLLLAILMGAVWFFGIASYGMGATGLRALGSCW
jgi:hypothetical protein